jgi:hypothetical protein
VLLRGLHEDFLQEVELQLAHEDAPENQAVPVHPLRQEIYPEVQLQQTFEDPHGSKTQRQKDLPVSVLPEEVHAGLQPQSKLQLVRATVGHFSIFEISIFARILRAEIMKLRNL